MDSSGKNGPTVRLAIGIVEENEIGFGAAGSCAVQDGAVEGRPPAPFECSRVDAEAGPETETEEWCRNGLSRPVILKTCQKRIISSAMATVQMM